MRKRLCTHFILSVLLIVFMISGAHADSEGVYWESEVVSTGMPKGLPPNLPKEAIA